MYIQNKRNSSKINGCSPILNCCNLISLKPAIAYFAYTQRWITFSLWLTKVATQQSCSRPFGNVIQRPAKPNCNMNYKINIQPKTGIEQNAIQHGLKRNLVRFLWSFEYSSKLAYSKPRT